MRTKCNQIFHAFFFVLFSFTIFLSLKVFFVLFLCFPFFAAYGFFLPFFFFYAFFFAYTFFVPFSFTLFLSLTFFLFSPNFPCTSITRRNKYLKSLFKIYLLNSKSRMTGTNLSTLLWKLQDNFTCYGEPQSVNVQLIIIESLIFNCHTDNFPAPTTRGEKLASFNRNY